MGKLPSVEELGPSPRADAERPVASYDTSGFSRGQQAFAAGLGKLGTGIEHAAVGLADYQLGEARFQYAKAHAGFVAEKIALDRQFAEDPDYATAKTRYEGSVAKLQDRYAETIGLPGMRERFVTDLKPLVAHGVDHVEASARALEGRTNVAYVSAQGDKLIDQAVTAGDEASKTAAIDSHNLLIDGLAAKRYIDPVQALAMKRDAAHRLAVADVLAAADSNDPARIQGATNMLRRTPGDAAAIDARIAQIESGGNAGAKNPRSSAMGLGQFTEGTWLGLMREHHPEYADRSDAEILALRADRALSMEMIGKLREENAASLRARGLEATPGNLYLAHFLGAGDAAKVLAAAPGTPVDRLLSPEVIDANKRVLAGKTAGTVTNWANGLMGGVGPGGEHLYDLIRPDQREQLLTRLDAAAHKQVTVDVAGFRSTVQDHLSEAAATGLVSKPLALSDFVAHFGADRGPEAFKSYQLEVQKSADLRAMAGMDPEQRLNLLEKYIPEPGKPGYAAQAQRHEQLFKVEKGIEAIEKVAADREIAGAALTDLRRLASLDPEQRNALIESYADRPDIHKVFVEAEGKLEGLESGYAVAGEIRRMPPLAGADRQRLLAQYPGDTPEHIARRKALIDAWTKLDKERDEDPAAYAIKYMPSVAEAAQKFAALANDPTATPQARNAAARDLATRQEIEQARLGVAPENRRMVPDAYIEAFNRSVAKAADSDDPNARIGLIAQVQREAQTWGEYWPAVMRQLAPTSQPIVRAIAAGADPAAMTRLLALPKNENPAAILKEQNETKAKDVDTALNNAFAPFLRSLVGAQKDRDYPGYYDLGRKLAALEVRDGKSADDAAANAFKALVGGRFEFRDTYRIPKSAGVAPDDVQAGAVFARTKLGELGAKPFANDLGLSDNAADSISKFARDGRWVTAPDGAGLNLIYDSARLGPITVRGADDRPLLLTWPQLASLGRDHRASRVPTGEPGAEIVP